MDNKIPMRPTSKPYVTQYDQFRDERLDGGLPLDHSQVHRFPGKQPLTSWQGFISVFPIVSGVDKPYRSSFRVAWLCEEYQPRLVPVHTEYRY